MYVLCIVYFNSIILGLFYILYVYDYNNKILCIALSYPVSELELGEFDYRC